MLLHFSCFACINVTAWRRYRNTAALSQIREIGQTVCNGHFYRRKVCKELQHILQHTVRMDGKEGFTTPNCKVRPTVVACGVHCVDDVCSVCLSPFQAGRFTPSRSASKKVDRGVAVQTKCNVNLLQLFVIYDACN